MASRQSTQEAVLLSPVWDIALIAGCLNACVPEARALVREGPERWAGNEGGLSPCLCPQSLTEQAVEVRSLLGGRARDDEGGGATHTPPQGTASHGKCLFLLCPAALAADTTGYSH